ncbi:TPA: methyl-accepting chemotaxis protein [Vibrio alginolyticus]|uniref:methyl-accepting chemotaxis protein n=1 Tax=Vibrio sp. 2-1(7) TaxID=2591011 RepID=UPI00148282AA|nr:PAS domain-containing methyl-accepting chemotaxis protein [Vibrio sp. 2-1(7)]NNN66856.1 PAS domain S-box protein [Vibrio sp. 2-1(7)]
MFFNKSLQKENQRLKQDLHSLQQIHSSLNEEMLCLTLDGKGCITSINANLQKQLLLTDTDVLNKCISELVPPNARGTEHFHRMKRAVQGKAFWNGALQVLKGNGEESWLRTVIQPIWDEHENVESFFVFATELTRTIKSSHEQVDMLNAISRSMAVIEFTLDGHVLKANENFLETMGYSLDQVVGKHHRMFCEQEEADSESYRQFWQRLAAGHFVSERFKRLNRYGDPVWLEASYNPIHNDRGELYKVVKFATEITQQVMQEQKMAQAAQLANDVSQETGIQTQQGQQVISSTLDKMKTLSEQMREANTAIDELKAHSARISELVNSISSIADQTNLLALNAAIEAARAGDHGRGFAVVADEVRQLATRTNATTDEIVTMVSENLQRTDNAVKLIAKCQQEALDTLELSESAGVVMNEIQNGARQVVDAVEQFNRVL